MTLHFRREVDKLKKMILGLGAMVEETVIKSVSAMEDNNVPLAKSIIENDNEIDQREVEVEEECLKILALHQPVAIDLRYVIAVLKINNDLERIGDIAVNIAERAISIAEMQEIEFNLPFSKMVNIAIDMLRNSLDSLIKLDPVLAREVCGNDDKVDAFHEKMYDKIQVLISSKPKYTALLIHYLSVSRNIERMADLATNIAEDVIYMVEGVIARHDKERLQLK